MANIERVLQARVAAAYQNASPLTIQGGGSKFVAGQANEIIDLTAHCGIVDYSPSELVVVVRAGTSLQELQKELSKNDQILGFEPPYADKGATIGGVIATGFAGSARPYRGGVRDYILGAKIVNGKGEVLQFGGKVMKNVAGFDLFRPMAGAMGSLGVLLEVSMRLIPKPIVQAARQVACADAQKGIELMSSLGKNCLSLTAAYWYQGYCTLRFSGSEQAVAHDVESLGEFSAVSVSQFVQLDHRQHPFFETALPIVRCSVKPAQSHLNFPDDQLIDWGGGQRFVATDTPITMLQEQLHSLGGSAVPLDVNRNYSPLALMPTSLADVHKALRSAIDPKRILNPIYCGN